MMAHLFAASPDNNPSTTQAPPLPLTTDADHFSSLGRLAALNRDDVREAAYEVFFTACSSSPVFHGRTTSQPDDTGLGSGEWGFGLSPVKPFGVGMAVTSRVKKALGLKMVRRPRRSSSSGETQPSSSPGGSESPRMGAAMPHAGRLRRPMTSAEIMRQQLRVTEQSDSRLRKTLVRALAGQMGSRAETIVLPLELLRHLKPADFSNPEEYHQWQVRQLKILEIGLLHHPCTPYDKSDPSAANLCRLIQASPNDTTKNSEAMRILTNSVISLARRSSDNDICHWADGYPLNVEIYITLLQAVFDLKEETIVLDEVDELLELIKKTWSMMGINRSMHNICFAWVFFQQYVKTQQIEPDLLGASLAMLSEVTNDAKRVNKEPTYVKMLAHVLYVMERWCEKSLLDYHKKYDKATVGLMEKILPLATSVTTILENYIPCFEPSGRQSGNLVEQCIRSSSKNMFIEILECNHVSITESSQPQHISEMLIETARAMEEFALKEKDTFGPIFKKWHPNAAGASAATLHSCYGTLLKKHLPSISAFMNETVLALQSAGRLERVLTQIAIEGDSEYRQRGKTFMKTWNPMSKMEPYTQSAAELINFVKEAVESFLQVPVNVSDHLVSELTDGLEDLLSDYITFAASCGSKQNYLPMLPPLTRCNHDSKLLKLWRKAATSIGLEAEKRIRTLNKGNNCRLSASRGTQRLYIRLNTLHYLLPQLQSLEKTLFISPNIIPPKKKRFGGRRQLGSSYFDHSQLAIPSACQHIAEVAAYRLVFMDANYVFYSSLYAGGVASRRIKPAAQILKHNLALMCVIITEKAQPVALKELMKACFEAYLMVLLAGGSSRVFSRTDHPLIEEDFNCLKRLFLTCGGGLLGEDEVAKEAQGVEGVVALMGQATEALVDEFSTLACEASGMGVVYAGQRLPMPPTTAKWHRSDPNTILRVLCHRNDRLANHFLKTTFQLAKRSVSM